MSAPELSFEAWQIRLVLPHRPPVLQLDRVDRCGSDLEDMQATKAVGGNDPMLHHYRAELAWLAPGALIEGLAQCCGMLLRLRWLAEAGADLAAFAGGDRGQLAAFVIPRSVLAESHARFVARPAPGAMLRLSIQRQLSRGDMHRFSGSVASVTSGGLDETVRATVMLHFPYRTQ